MEDQTKRGQILKLTESEARGRYPNLTVASLGANSKEKATGDVTARVLFDGTHGIDVNRRTRVRDQERGPIAADIKSVLREKAKSPYHSFALTADVTEAHRQIPIDPREGTSWGLGVNKYGGTFGVASASYWWSRVAGAVGRLTQYLPGQAAQTWHLLVADDYQLDASNPSYREAIIGFFVLCSLLGVPLS